MFKTAMLYGSGFAFIALCLTWLQFQYIIHTLSVEFYTLLIAAGFTALGVWAGHRLTRRAPQAPFEINHAALDALGISPREYEVLECMAAGESNKEIARSLKISPNTVKTHTSRLYEKLDVNSRMHAIKTARSLYLIV